MADSGRNKAYLVLYNLLSALGWAYLAYSTVTSFLEGTSYLVLYHYNEITADEST